MDYDIPCCLCGDVVSYQISHNAHPVKDGRCCNSCNMEIVVPRRCRMLVLEIKPNNQNEKNIKS